MDTVPSGTNGKPSRKTGRISRFFDMLGILGFLLVIPAILLVLGKVDAAKAPERALGAFASSGALLVGFVCAELLAGFFGSGSQALPLLTGMICALVYFGGAFDLPWLGFLRSVLGRIPAFSSPGPPLSAGVLSILLGMVSGSFGRGRSRSKALAIITISTAVFVALSVWNPFPKTDSSALSVEGALQGIAAQLGKEYRSPDVEQAVRKVLDDSKATEAEKDQRIAELTERLRKSEEDSAALKKAAQDSEVLTKELLDSKNALEELRGKLNKGEPLIVGQDYSKAVQPNDPTVRDYAVRIASRSPGAFDDPQGSRIPSEAGIAQVRLIHAAISSAWKYVSDPGVSWSDYASPARRTLALGLAGDCDDFAILMASCIEAVGGRTRIVHGTQHGSGHAWAEAWLGAGEQGRVNLRRVASQAGRSYTSLVAGSDDQAGTWLILDWRFGELSINPDRKVVAWTGG